MARRNTQTQSEALAESVEVAEGPKPEPIDFDVWFSLLKTSNPSFREWQRPQLRAFMRSKGLSEKEPKAIYDSAFEKF